MNEIQYKDLFLTDKCMVHRYRYYVMNSPVITDYEYDMMEKEAKQNLNKHHSLHRPGSDNPEHYPQTIREIAESLTNNNI